MMQFNMADSVHALVVTDGGAIFLDSSNGTVGGTMQLDENTGMYGGETMPLRRFLCHVGHDRICF